MVHACRINFLLSRKQQIKFLIDVDADWKWSFRLQCVSLNGNFIFTTSSTLRRDVEKWESKTHQSKIIAQFLNSFYLSLVLFSIPWRFFSHHHQFDFNQCRVIILNAVMRIYGFKYKWKISETGWRWRKKSWQQAERVIIKLLRIWQWHWKNSRE